MAALALENENAVWQKVFQMLGGQAGTGSQAAADPASVNAFRALKLQLSTQRLAPQLQFVPFGEADVDAATGFAGPTGAFTLYGMWGKKSGTGTTAAFLEVHDKNSITGSTDVKASLYFKGTTATTGSQETSLIAPKGIAFVSTTGSAIGSVTAIGGATPTTGDSDSQHGFIIVGAPS